VISERPPKKERVRKFSRKNIPKKVLHGYTPKINFNNIKQKKRLKEKEKEKEKQKQKKEKERKTRKKHTPSKKD
jgi:hypothetical protein